MTDTNLLCYSAGIELNYLFLKAGLHTAFKVINFVYFLDRQYYKFQYDAWLDRNKSERTLNAVNNVLGS